MRTRAGRSAPVLRGARTVRSGYVQTALCALGTVVTATLYGAFFAGGGYLPRLAAFAVTGAAVAYAPAVRRLRGPAVLVIGLAAFAVCSVYAVPGGRLHAGLPGPAALRARARGLAGGWAAMLSIGTPAPLTARMLMTPAAVTFAAAFLATAAALRTRAVLGPAAALLPAEVVGLLYVADQPGRHLAQAAALLTVLLVLTVIRAAPAAPARRPGPRPSAAVPSPAGTSAPSTPPARTETVHAAAHPAARAAAVAVIVAAGLLSAAALPLARGDHRFDPRTLLPSALHIDPVLSPLAQVRAQLQLRPAATLFTIGVPGGSGVDRVQTTSLDTFDGARWTSSASFLVAGPVLAAGPRLPGAAPVTEHITVAALAGPFLPSAGRPARVRADLAPGARIGFDRRSGTLVTDAESLKGATYTLTGVPRPPASGTALSRAAVATGPAWAAYTEQPAVPAPLAALATRLTARAHGPYAKLVAVDDYLRGLPYSLQAPPGESYAALASMLVPASAQDSAGYGEQHAAAFAVLARALGLPARIAVGYLLPPARHGTYTVTTADAYAWPQVYFERYGWVDFDPTDVTRTVRVVPRRRPPVPPPAARPAPPPAAPRPPSAVPTRVPGARPGHGWRLPLTAAAYALAGLLAAAAATGPVAKEVRRRRRRTRGGPSVQVAGAWREVTDRLAEAGLPVPAALTAEEVAERARRADPGTRQGRALLRVAHTLGRLAPMASHAVYAAEPYRPADAARAWQLEHRLRGELYPRRLTARRAIHRLKPIRPERRSRRSAPYPGGRI